MFPLINFPGSRGANSQTFLENVVDRCVTGSESSQSITYFSEAYSTVITEGIVTRQLLLERRAKVVQTPDYEVKAFSSS